MNFNKINKCSYCKVLIEPIVNYWDVREHDCEGYFKLNAYEIYYRDHDKEIILCSFTKKVWINDVNPFNSTMTSIPFSQFNFADDFSDIKEKINLFLTFG